MAFSSQIDVWNSHVPTSKQTGGLNQFLVKFSVEKVI